MNEDAQAPELEIDVAPQYEAIDHWIVLTTNGQNPRVLKSEPRGLAPSEVSIKLRLLVPKRTKRIAQTIVVKLPDELSHVASIEVAVPEARDG